MRARGYLDLATGIAAVPLVALGACFLASLAHSSIAELGRLALVLQGV